MAKKQREYSREDKLRAIHHFVPQSYLRRFAIEGKPNQVYAYEIDKEPYATNIKNVAGQRDLYTFNDIDSKGETAELEDVFADIDAQGIELLQLLDTLPDGFVVLPEEQKGNLFSYIAFLHTRNVQERKQWAESYGQMSLVQMQMIASNEEVWHRDAKEAMGDKYDYDQAESSRNALLDGKMKVEFNPMDQYFLGTTLAMSKELYFVLMKLKKAVLVSTDTQSKHFVTSDNPVTHYRPEKDNRPKWMGLGYINAVFQLPISPTRCLLLINDDMRMRTFKCTRGEVDHMNWYTYYYADRWIFSHIKSKTVMQMFKDHRAKEPFSKIDSPFERAKKRKDSEKT
jgi:hypothetical protein